MAAGPDRREILREHRAARDPRRDPYPVVDATGGTSEETHLAGLERVIQAGGRPVGWVVVELQRDWAREETVAGVMEIVLTGRSLEA